MEPLPDNFRSLEHAQKDELIVLLHGAVVRLEKRVAELEGQLAKNSTNSSKPSSTDGLDKPDPKPRRDRSGKTSGGQKGHPGTTLKRVAEPDHRVDHEPLTCGGCGASLDGAPLVGTRRRQVFDIPPVAVEVTEHCAVTRRCSCGTCTSGAFPDGVTSAVQYGPRLHATVVYLAQYQLVPMARLTELLDDLFGLTISQGTVNNLLGRCSDRLEDFEARAIAAVRAAPAAHFDESGVRVGGKLHWLHVASTLLVTCYLIHPRRGLEAMRAMGVLEGYQGYAVHDHWGPYFGVEDVLHVLCNAHHIRELVYVHERYGQAWAKWLIRMLVDTHREVEAAKAAGHARLDERSIDRIERRYRRILKKAEAELPGEPAPPPGTTGKRAKRHKAVNLHARLRDFMPETLGFVHDFDRPFDNNQAERDVRMVKVKQKISGCFRSQAGAAVFCRIRGYVSTAKKQGRGVMGALTDALAGRAFDPSEGPIAQTG